MSKDTINLIKSIASIGFVKIKSNNVINSLLWIVSSISLISLFLFFFSQDPFKQKTFLCLIVFPIGLCFIAYIYFAIKNPDYLRSEEFQLKKNYFEHHLTSKNENAVEKKNEIKDEYIKEICEIKEDL